MMELNIFILRRLCLKKNACDLVDKLVELLSSVMITLHLSHALFQCFILSIPIPLYTLLSSDFFWSFGVLCSQPAPVFYFDIPSDGCIFREHSFLPAA